jgi:hypothetical protein
MQPRLMILERVPTRLWEDRLLEERPFHQLRRLRMADILNRRKRNQHMAEHHSLERPRRYLVCLPLVHPGHQCSQAMEELHRTVAV